MFCAEGHRVQVIVLRASCLQGSGHEGGSFMLFADADSSVTPVSCTHFSRRVIVCVSEYVLSTCFSFNALWKGGGEWTVRWIDDRGS